ncbi:MAG TPA: HIT family protein [Nanoarchaeota archaeon]|nr:MAG: Hit-like protein involved in cell-cycle regulation [archaeon GW2011_AR6]MBS3082573.1 HIT family protein [Candidatus Pacearchaeota archaeon]HIH17466.1 HIT family protein [Nanoarchaeota archaeon]HIH33951.1 HIT family protein [Nanoarchaeota archaeon]HIH51758.1 HIT family protein [Nanoarchaeota archaeon]
MVKKELKEELSEEQIAQLKRFAELPPDKKLELIEKQCIFCQISKGSIETIKVFEDSEIIVALDINPAVPGHTLIFPKKHFQFLFQISPETREKIFSTASSLSIYLVNVLKAGGFNLYVANGATAGQKMPHFVLHLIPRFDKDGLSFDWDAKKANQEELKKIAAMLKTSLEKEMGEKKKSYKEEAQAQSDSSREIERALKFRRRA